jgi:hypothetical protein
MSQDTENFEQLRRLLKIKRYEQPPPRYFNDFSSHVIARIARIERGERGDGHASVGRMLWEAPWLQRIWAAFEAKPLLAGAFGLAVCATLISGVIFSERTDLQPVVGIPGSESSISSPVEFANVMAENHSALINPAAAVEGSSISPSAAMQTGGPLFENLLAQPQGLHAEPASFALPGRN